MPEKLPNQIGEAVIPVEVTGSDESVRRIKEVEAALESLGKTAGGNGGKPGPGAVDVTASEQSRRIKEIVDSFGNGSQGVDKLAGGFSTLTNAVRGFIALNVAESLTKMLTAFDEMQARLDEFNVKLQNAQQNQRTAEAREMRESRVGVMTAAGLPEFFARGGTGPREQAAKDALIDRERQAVQQDAELKQRLQTLKTNLPREVITGLLTSPRALLGGSGGVSALMQTVAEPASQVAMQIAANRTDMERARAQGPELIGNARTADLMDMSRNLDQINLNTRRAANGRR